MRRLSAFAVVLVATLAVAITPAGAILNGQPDGERHPYVALVTFYDDEGVYLWRCTGTLMSPTVLLTAGHCTEPPAASAQAWFESGPIENGDYPLTPVEDRPPCAGFTGWPCTGSDATGAVHTHPDYDPNAFFLHDLGVVTFALPGVTGRGFGALPTEGQLSELPKHATFTAVGYGLQKSFPPSAAWKDQDVKVRLFATPKLVAIDDKKVGDIAILLSSNGNTGGTCFGDSGGPNFIGDTNVVGAVTSFGRTWTCRSPGGAYRIDQPDDLEWLAEFGLTPG